MVTEVPQPVLSGPKRLVWTFFAVDLCGDDWRLCGQPVDGRVVQAAAQLRQIVRYECRRPADEELGLRVVDMSVDIEGRMAQSAHHNVLEGVQNALLDQLLVPRSHTEDS